MADDTTCKESAGTTMERHTQTVLVLVLVALLVWVGNTTQQTAISVAKLQTDVEYMQRRMEIPDGKFKEIEKRLDSIEAQLSSIRARQENYNEQ